MDKMDKMDYESVYAKMRSLDDLMGAIPPYPRLKTNEFCARKAATLHSSLITNPIYGIYPIEPLGGHCFQIYFENGKASKNTGISISCVSTNYGLFEILALDQKGDLIYDECPSVFDTTEEVLDEIRRVASLALQK